MKPGLFAVRDAVRAGERSARSAVAGALAEVAAVDRELQAVTQLFADEALEAAERCDRRIARGEDPGPLAGLPFMVKDVIATTRGATTGGSRILEGYRSPFAATVVDRLERAGAILIGKTNLDEFAMGSSTENSAYQVTRNPWKTTHVPGGSSGGAAALAAAASGIIQLGSDTGGSIRQPAAYCGVSGFKPSYGRVSRWGLLAFASSLDQIGPIQGTALECALVLETIAGADPFDSTARDLPVKSYVAECAKGLGGLRLGVPKEYFPEGVDPEVRERVLAAVDALRELGAEVREVSLPHTRYANPAYVLISAAEASSNLARYDGVHFGYRCKDPRSLLDLYCRSRGEGFGAEVKRRVMIGTFVLSSGYYDAYYLKALRVRSLIRRDFDRAFGEVDAIVCPTSPIPAFPIGARISDPLQLYAVDILTVTANLAALPGISVPCGLTTDGLPIGLQILGRPFEDEVPLRVAHGFQQATRFHESRPPVRAGAAGGPR